MEELHKRLKANDLLNKVLNSLKRVLELLQCMYMYIELTVCFICFRLFVS